MDAKAIAQGIRRVYDNAAAELRAGSLNVDGYYSAENVALAALDRAAPKGSKLHREIYDAFQQTFREVR